MHAGDFPIPDGWTAETMGFSGHRDAKKKADNVDQVIFSPGVRAGGGGPAVGVRLVIGWLLRGRALRIVEAVWCWWHWPAEKNREIWLSDRLHRMLVIAWVNR